MMHLLHKGFMEDYLCWHAHGELVVRNESMEERVVGSIFSASNVHGVENDNNNCCYPILTYVLIHFQKNPKIEKKHRKSKKYVFFNIFTSFLASSQKNLNFQRFLECVRLLTRYF